MKILTFPLYAAKCAIVFPFWSTISDKYITDDVAEINNLLYTITSSSSNKKREEIRKYLTIKKDDVNISVEIDDNYNIIPKDDNIECIYAVFPLIGIERHILPFSINSPKFEPANDRNSLQLSGEEYEDGKLSIVGINRELLLSSLDLYEELINELLNNHCSNIHELSRGLKLNTCPYKYFDLVWYENKILQPMRNILAQKVTVNSCQNKSIYLSEVFFPEKAYDEQFFNLSALKKYYPKMISYKDFMKWEDFIWTIPRVVSIDDLIKKVQNDISLFEESHLESFNEILSFLWKYDKGLLYSQPLIPNMNNELRCFINDGIYIKGCKNVSEDIIQIIEAIDIPWKLNHINNKINSVKFDEVI